MITRGTRVTCVEDGKATVILGPQVTDCLEQSCPPTYVTHIKPSHAGETNLIIL